MADEPKTPEQKQKLLNEIYKEIQPELGVWRNPNDSVMAAILKERAELFDKHPALLSGHVAVPDRVEGDLGPEETTVLIAALKAQGHQLAQQILARQDVKSEFLNLRELHMGVPDGPTALYYAVKGGLPEFAADLLKKGASPENLDGPQKKSDEKPARKNILHLAAAHPELLKNAAFREQLHKLQENKELWARLTKDNIGIIHLAATPEAMTTLVRDLGVSPRSGEDGRKLTRMFSMDVDLLWKEYPQQKLDPSKPEAAFHDRMIRLFDRTATAIELGADITFDDPGEYMGLRNDGYVPHAKSSARSNIVPGERYKEEEVNAILGRYEALEARFNVVFAREEGERLSALVKQLKTLKAPPPDASPQQKADMEAKYRFAQNERDSTNRRPLAVAIMRRDWDIAAELVAEGASLDDICGGELAKGEDPPNFSHSAFTLLARHYDDKLPGSRLEAELKKLINEDIKPLPPGQGKVVYNVPLLFLPDVMRHVRGSAERLKFFSKLHPDFSRENKWSGVDPGKTRVSEFIAGVGVFKSPMQALHGAIEQKILPPIQNSEELNSIILYNNQYFSETNQADPQASHAARKTVVDWLIREATRLKASPEKMDMLVTVWITASLETGDYATLNMIGEHIGSHPDMKNGAFARRISNYDDIKLAATEASLDLKSDAPIKALKAIGVPCPLGSFSLQLINKKISEGAVSEKFGRALISEMRKDGVDLLLGGNSKWLPAVESVISNGDVAGMKRLIALDVVTGNAEALDVMIKYAKGNDSRVNLPEIQGALTNKDNIAGIAGGPAAMIPAIAETKAARKEIIQLLEAYKERFKQVEKFGAPLSAAPATLDEAFTERQHLPPPPSGTKGLPPRGA